MKLERQAMLRGMYRRDTALDGRYLVAVQTTRIYCLPSCPARKPNPENVIFFLSPDAARSAGFRACRRCRPDLHYRGIDPDLDTLVELTRRMRADPARYASTRALAATSGFGATKLAELTREHYHTTPARLLLRARVAAARRLLEAREVATGDVGFAVGFESATAYYRNFKALTGLSPGDYRALPERDEMHLALPASWRPDALLRILGRDPTSPSERVNGACFVKSFTVRGSAALLHVQLEAGRAYCRVETSGTPASPMMHEAHALAARLLSLEHDPSRLIHQARDARERALFARRPGMRFAVMSDPFEALCWAITGQQVNVSFATTLRRRLIEHCDAPAPRGMRVHPAADVVADLDVSVLRGMQYSGRKAEHLIGAARAVATGDLPVYALAGQPVARARHGLLAQPGIGPWTTEYMLMRGLGFEDCVPVGDAALVAALRRFYALAERPDAEQTRELMARFAPHRSAATEHFWHSLGDEADEQS